MAEASEAPTQRCGICLRVPRESRGDCELRACGTCATLMCERCVYFVRAELACKDCISQTPEFVRFLLRKVKELTDRLNNDCCGEPHRHSDTFAEYAHDG